MNDSHLDFTTLNEYLDETLPQQRRSQVEQHLAACPTCRRELAELQEVFVALAELPELPLPRDLSDVVMQRLHPQPALEPAFSWLIPAVQLILACGLLVLAWSLLAPRLALETLVASTSALLLQKTGVWTSLLLPWQTWINGVQAWIGGRRLLAYDLLPASFSPGLAQNWWILLLLATGALWLAGNYWGLAGGSDDHLHQKRGKQ